jgi:hypothetical protein
MSRNVFSQGARDWEVQYESAGIWKSLFASSSHGKKLEGSQAW